MSGPDHLKAIQHAFQRSIAASATIPLNTVKHDLGAPVKPAQYVETQNTFPDLASTVPDSQALINTANSPPAIPDAVEIRADGKIKKMSSQGSVPQDTQPLSQSVYESIITKAKSSRQPGQSEEPAIATEAAQDYLQKGDEGHIDLLSSYKAQEPDADDQSDSEPVEFSPTQTQHHLSQFPESQRFKTPGTTSRKRNYNGEFVETPSLPRNPLARNGGPTPGKVMGLSQAFAATQAVSSPLLHRLSSGPFSDRPSPNIDLETRPATASISSPIRPRSDLRRTATEPYSHYKSMKQSQAERERLALLEESDREELGTISDDEFEDESSLIERRRRQRDREEKVRKQFKAVSSPTRPRSRETVGPFPSPLRHPRSSSPRTSPRSRKSSLFKARLATSAEHTGLTDEVDLPHESEEETEQEDEIEIAVKRSSQVVTLSEENKENAGFLGMEVPETVAAIRRIVDDDRAVDASPSLRRSMDEDHPRLRSPQTNGIEPFAVADSQPSQPAHTISQQARNLLPSSEDGTSVVPQSQMPSSHIPVHSSFLAQSSPVKIVGVDPLQVPHRVEAVGGASDDHIMVERTSSGEDAAAEHEVTIQEQEKLAFVETALAGTMKLGVQARRDASRKLAASESTIPETSSVGRKESDIASSAKQSIKSKPITLPGEETSRSSNEFETAHTRMSTAPEIVLPALPAQRSFVTASPSGRKRRRMTEIAADPSPRKSGGDFDVEAALKVVENEDFEETMGQSPVRPDWRSKRRRLNQPRIPSSSPNAILVVEEQESIRRPSEFDNRVIPLDMGVSVQTDQRMAELPIVNEKAMRSTLRTKSASRQLAAPVPKLSFGRATTRSSRVDVDLWAIEASPEKPVAMRNRLQVAQRQKPPSAMPASKVRSAINITTPASALSARRSKRRNSHGSTGVVNDSPDHLALSTSDRSHVTNGPSAGDVVAPNQVLACFNGKTRAYYPATCIGITGSESLRYLIKWEGYAEPDEIDARSVRKLDLRVGDAVKIDGHGFPKVSHVVRGFKTKVVRTDNIGALTDVRGYTKLLVAPKQRKSLPVDLDPETVKEVPISAVYLDSNMWGQMKGREYEYTSNNLLHEPGFATPLDRPSTPTTPSSRSRRNAAFSTSTTAVQPIGIFTNMAFAISYPDEHRKSSLTRIINSNGGTVLVDGFHELFTADTMALKPYLANIGFTALLADRHSRKEKYLQALALNLPCLSGKWIESCTRKGTIVNWQSYLLPAGDSSVLEGMTRSRILPPIADVTTVKVADMIASRPNLLCGHAAVLVTGRGKAEEKRKAMIFLAQAAGAGKLQRAMDLRTAVTHATENEDVRWILVDDRDVGTATSMLEEVVDREGDTIGAIRVVNNEFICQSLILGALIEE